MSDDVSQEETRTHTEKGLLFGRDSETLLRPTLPQLVWISAAGGSFVIRPSLRHIHMTAVHCVLLS